jgi:hypothetical protein
MVAEKLCPMYRKPEGLGMGVGLGYCDIDSGSAICEGDVFFCEKQDALKKYLRSKIEEFEEKDKQ